MSAPHTCLVIDDSVNTNITLTHNEGMLNQRHHVTLRRTCAQTVRMHPPRPVRSFDVFLGLCTPAGWRMPRCVLLPWPLGLFSTLNLALPLICPPNMPAVGAATGLSPASKAKEGGGMEWALNTGVLRGRRLYGLTCNWLAGARWVSRRAPVVGASKEPPASSVQLGPSGVPASKWMVLVTFGGLEAPGTPTTVLGTGYATGRLDILSEGGRRVVEGPAG